MVDTEDGGLWLHRATMNCCWAFGELLIFYQASLLPLLTSCFPWSSLICTQICIPPIQMDANAIWAFIVMYGDAHFIYLSTITLHIILLKITSHLMVLSLSNTIINLRAEASFGLAWCWFLSAYFAWYKHIFLFTLWWDKWASLIVTFVRWCPRN